LEGFFEHRLKDFTGTDDFVEEKTTTAIFFAREGRKWAVGFFSGRILRGKRRFTDEHFARIALV
jgi:hypothetical protein